MAITKIEVDNFTVFESIAIEFGSGINVFIGENGTGKTHLLKLLYSYCNCEYEISFNYGFSTDFFLETIKNFGTSTLHELHNNHPNSTSVLVKETSEVMIGGEIVKTDEITRNITQKGSVMVKISTGNPTKQLMFPFLTTEAIYKAEIYRQMQSTLPSSKSVTPSVFIPAKDMLVHSKGLLAMKNKYSKDMPFDKTHLDIIERASQWKVDDVPEIAKKILPLLEREMGGKVLYENDTFYIIKHNGEKVSFACEAEGMKKLGLLWQLLMNESITEGTVLLWDEPEANINPKIISDLVEIMLELSRNGVQIFIATHDYFLPKYIDVLAKEDDSITFHTLHKTDAGVKCETNRKFSNLDNNDIVDEVVRLYEKEITRAME